MTFTRRQRMLLMELIKQDDFLTSKQLSLYANVSIRTIKSEVKRINEILEVYDIFIESKTGVGYIMNTVGKKEIADINDFLDDLGYDPNVFVVESMEERIVYIANRLLDNEMYIKSEVLADELFISTSTLSHDLKQVKYIFQNYDLKISSKPYKGIRIIGKEKNIRNCIDFLNFKNKEKRLMRTSYDENANRWIEYFVETLTVIADTYEFPYPSYCFYDIAVQTYITFFRVSKGFHIDYEQYSGSILAKKMTSQYLQKLCEKWGISMGASEVMRMECMIDTLYVLAEDHENDTECTLLLESALQDINATYSYDFEQEFHLLPSLKQHMKQLIKRCQYEVRIYNPLADCILKDYFLSVDFANVLARKLEEHFHFTISLDEFSYLVLYFNVTVYAQSKMKEKALYIYCPSSRAEEQLIYEEVRRLFKEIVLKIEVVSKEQLDNMKYNGLDIFITNVSLPPCVPNYVQRIEADLNYKLEFISKILIQLNEQVKGYFNLKELLSEDMFYINKAIASKEEYYEFLFDSLCDAMVMDYGEANYLYEKVEKLGQEVGNHVVFVRSQNKFVMPFIHITFVKDLFYWDTGYVKVIIFINFADSSVEFRDCVYQYFKRLFSNKTKIDQLLHNPSFINFLSLLAI